MDRTEARSAMPQPGGEAPLPGWLLLVVCGLAALLVFAIQVVGLPQILDPVEPLTAGHAKPLVVAFTLAVAAVLGGAAMLPQDRIALPVVFAGAVAALALIATLLVGGELWSLAAAALTMSACWISGAWVLRTLRMPALAAMPPVSWLAGVGVIGLLILLLGKIELLRWWTAGIAVLGLGALGLYRIASDAGPPARKAWAAVTETRLAAGCAGLIALLMGLAAIWAAAPELMFDALYFKSWLPAEWARAGEIAPLRTHSILNQHGFGPMLAIPGHLFGAEGVGRYLQWLAVGLLPAAMWRFLRSRTPWAPLAAAAIAITPQLIWQATTAYDDALITFAGLAIAIAVVVALEQPQRWPLREGIALGLLAGACIDLKLHIVWLALGVVGAFVLLRPGARVRTALGALAGGLLAGGPPLLLRWVEVGNPVLPALNNVFKSEYWAGDSGGLSFGSPEVRAPEAEDDGGFLFRALDQSADLLWRSLTETITLSQAAPDGAYGIVTLAVAAALLLVGVAIVRHRIRERELVALWVALALACAGWYLQFRYLRFLLPTGAVAVIMIALTSRGHPLGRRAQAASLAALAALAIVLWPTTVAQFWNVPGKDLPLAVALDSEDDYAYERRAMRERDALAAFNRLSPPGARAVTFAHQRSWLSEGRDLLLWFELVDLMQRGGRTQPDSSDEALRRTLATGAEWSLVKDIPHEPRPDYMAGLVSQRGDLAWADSGWSLYRLTDRPLTPKPFPACDEALAGTPGCWRGELDAQPGYTAADPAPMIIRAVSICPGRLLTADIRTEGRGQAEVQIDFDGPDPTRGHVRPVVAGSGTTRVGGTAPPGASYGAVRILRPPPGLKVTRVRFGRLGDCGGPPA